VNPTVIDEGGTLIVADTIAELAAAIPAPMDALQDTVELYNTALATGGGAELATPRTGDPVPLLRPPFRALPLIAGVYFTMGGPLVNGRAQVLDSAERPIEGLFAAGGTMGGLMGGPQAGYAGGWAEASTFGLIAGENAIAEES
jgi:fumarate reductase flavoprotein subunit